MKKSIMVSIVFLALAGSALSANAFEHGIDIHGFASQGYVQTDKYNTHDFPSEEGSFEFNEVGLTLSAKPYEDIRFGMQFISLDMGEVGNNDVGIDWVYGDYQFRNWLGIRLGKVKRALGIFNQSRDIDSSRTAIFLPAAVYPTETREVSLASTGVNLYGRLPVGIDYQLNYGVLGVEPDGGIAKTLNQYQENLYNKTIFPAVGFTSTARASTYKTEVDKSYSVYLKWDTPMPGFSLGYSFSDYDFTLYTQVAYDNPQTGDTRTRYMDYHAFGEYHYFSLQYFFKDLMLAAEYKIGQAENKTFSSGSSTPTKGKVTPESYYLMATYRFNEWFELGGYYMEAFEDKDDKDGDYYASLGWQRSKAFLKSWVLTTRFDLNPSWTFKLEGHINYGLKDKDVDISGYDDPSNHWYMGAAKVTFMF